MSNADLLKDLLRQVHIYLEAKMDICPEDAIFDKAPDATIASIGAIYAHAVLTEDEFVHRRIGTILPLYQSPEWTSRLEFPPKVAQDRTWTQTFRTDIGAFRQYAKVVFAAGEAWIAGRSDEDLSRGNPSHFIDLEDGQPVVARREVPLGLLFADNVILHTSEHTGEISALLGARGLKGSRWG